MNIKPSPSKPPLGGAATAFTLVEVVIAVAITALLFGGIIVGNTFTCRRAEWTGYSLAAQSLGVQQLEQARAGIWDRSLGVNDITNLNLQSWSYNSGTQTGTGYSVSILDIPVTGTNFVYATNYVTVQMLALPVNTNVLVQMVKIDTVWPFNAGRKTKLFTNSIATYLAPDNRDPSTL